MQVKPLTMEEQEHADALIGRRVVNAVNATLRQELMSAWARISSLEARLSEANGTIRDLRDQLATKKP